MKISRVFLVFAYGLFTISAQTLLFREFLTSLEGNDISVGLFFASWFFWVGLGALTVNKLPGLSNSLFKKIELLFLAYIPAFALQMFVIIQARTIASVEHFDLLNIRTILLFSFIANAPVSFITGMLFPTACRWFTSQNKQPVSSVYILEAAGSFAGGLGVTLLLGFGVSSASIALILAVIVSLCFAFVKLAEIRKTQKYRFGHFFLIVFVLLMPAICLICLLTGLDRNINKQIHLAKWSNLLPKESYEGSFTTAQAEYLLGSYQGQFVIISNGQVIEAIPDESSTGLAAAIALSQNTNAKNILVIGSGPGLCKQFLKLGQTESVAWAYPDKEYLKKINQKLPSEEQIKDARFKPVSDDIRPFLRENKHYFDIVVVNLPEPDTSVLNRYFTVQFYELVRSSLSKGGIVTVRVAGGENVMGEELAALGSSIKLSLQKVFSQFYLTAGENSYFIASESEIISGEPALLRERFGGIRQSDTIFPPDALLSVYLPDRAEKALSDYENVTLPESQLINTDARPLTYLFSLLLTAKRSGTNLIQYVKLLSPAGYVVFLVPIAVVIIMRFFYLCGKIRRRKTSSELTAAEYKSSFDSSFLAFSSGLLSIGVVIILMYIYQTRFGSLYLHIGLISSLFMLGLTFGAAIIKYLIKNINLKKSLLILAGVILFHIFLLVLIAYWPLEKNSGVNDILSQLPSPTHVIFAIEFFISGVCDGCYFPVAAKLLSEEGFEASAAAAQLEMSDHLGACAGGLLTSLMLVPIFGTAKALLLLIILIGANLPAVLLRILTPAAKQVSAKTDSTKSKLGYTLFTIAATLLICSNILANQPKPKEAVIEETPEIAAALAENNMAETRSFTTEEEETIDYYVVYENNKVKGYIFHSGQLAPEVRGYGGRMNIEIFVDSEGKLIDFEIVRSNETPRYLNRVLRRKEMFEGVSLLSEQSFEKLDAVTGATISYNAISKALQLSTSRFFEKVLKKVKAAERQQYFNKFIPDKSAIYLVSAVILSFIIMYFGGRCTRLALLFANVLLAGFWLNLQYSTNQITNILSLNFPATEFTGLFLLTAVIPLIVFIFGNIYCGYLCPFGALQELLSYIIPYKFKPTPPKEALRKGAFIRYVILFIFIITFFLIRKPSALNADPLISIFARLASVVLLITAGIALAGSLFYTRFFCIYLCPTGAFLSLINRFAPLRRVMPRKRYSKCEFAIGVENLYDCINCDRCLHENAPSEKESLSLSTNKAKTFTVLFFGLVTIAASVISGITINNLLQHLPEIPARSFTAVFESETPANADVERIKNMIEENRLSDREALYYKKVK